MFKSFCNKFMDIFFHKPTESEMLYSYTRSMLLDAESWVNRDPMAEATFLALIRVKLEVRINSLSGLNSKILDVTGKINESNNL